MAARKRRSRRKSGGKRKFRWVLYLFGYPFLAGVLFVLGLAIYLDFFVRAQFDSKRFSAPASVYARPLELFPSKKISQKELLYELNRMKYRLDDQLPSPGTYRYESGAVYIHTRSFTHFDGTEKEKNVKVTFEDNVVAEISNNKTKADVPILRLDPVLIGKIYPNRKEDRILVQMKSDVPEKFVKTLTIIEDREFYSHWGFTIKGIGRAALQNVMRGRYSQGGSTITQQLAKNYFLTRERTLWRKFKELIMAVLIEIHYEKGDILEAYLNEVYLDTAGGREVRGFGLASKHFFNKALNELDYHEIALLVGMVKAPSAYNPMRNPDKALRRRNLVLNKLREFKVISEEELLNFKSKPLGIQNQAAQKLTEYPAFVDLLRNQLKRDYKEEDLTTGGLRIFTTLDPIVQYYAEEALKTQISLLERSHRLKKNKLQGAVVVTSSNDGKVVAIVGGRDPRFHGYNRALSSQRQIGSLIKPVVYLTALQRKDYTLATQLDDSPYVLEKHGKIWAPKNYDKNYHGNPPLFLSLAHSYNVSTARMGMHVGLDKVIENIHKMGIKKKINAYPSLLLGALSLSPVEVAQMYQTFAGGGFNTPLRSINAVMNSKGEKIQSYPLKLAKVIDSDSIYQVNVAMQHAISIGTGRGMARFLSNDFGIAGKTGTTDEKRDSWFSGFTGNYLAVVWLGMDNEKDKHGLTGSTGALRVWGSLMKHINPDRLNLEPPSQNFVFEWIDPESGYLSSKNCNGAVQLPFIKGTAPTQNSSCAGRSKWFNFFKTR